MWGQEGDGLRTRRERMEGGMGVGAASGWCWGPGYILKVEGSEARVPKTAPRGARMAGRGAETRLMI